jgi:hypothetical protein
MNDLVRTSTNRECCATCDFWGTFRLLKHGDIVSEEFGICSNKRGRYARETRYNDSCSKYFPWMAMLLNDYT